MRPKKDTARQRKSKLARGKAGIEGEREKQKQANELASEDGGGGVLRGEDVGGVQISPPLHSEKRETRDARQR